MLKQRKREQDFVKELGMELTDGAEKEVVSKKPTKSSQKQDNEAENLNETEKDAENE